MGHVAHCLQGGRSDGVLGLFGLIGSLGPLGGGWLCWLWLLALTRLFGHLEVFVVDTADGDGYSAEVEDQLAVAVYADDVALVATEGACEDAELHVFLGELVEGFSKEGDLIGMGLHDTHEGLHDSVGDGGGQVVAGVFDEIVAGQVERQEVADALDGALQEDETADRGPERLLHALLRLLVLIAIVVGLMDEEGLFGVPGVIGVVGVKPLAKGTRHLVMEVKIAPRSGELRGVAGELRGLAMG